MKSCYRCKGGGKIFKKGRFTAEDKFWGRNQETCPVCYGSGKDPNWYTVSCRAPGCWREFDVNRSWNNTPDYCEAHRGDQYKSCKGCGRQLKFRYSWNNIPDFCESCKKDWQEKRCASNGCKNTVRYKRAWDSIPDHCGWCQKNIQQGATARQCADCATLIWVPSGKNYIRCRDCGNKRKTATCSGCSRSFEYPAHYNNPPRLCDSCKKTVDLFRRDMLPTGVRDIRGKAEISNGHVTMYFPGLGGPKGYRVSWDGSSHNLHWTNQNVGPKHPDRHKPPQ